MINNLMKDITLTYKGFIITTNKNQFFKEQIHQWLSQESYWAKNIPIEKVYNSINHSFCIGIIREQQQIGFARLVTDYTTFGYLADVYIVEEHRGKGLSKKMLETLMELYWVKGLRRIMLATFDAHELYTPLGFCQPKFPTRLMEIVHTDMYNNKA